MASRQSYAMLTCTSPPQPCRAVPGRAGQGRPRARAAARAWGVAGRATGPRSLPSTLLMPPRLSAQRHNPQTSGDRGPRVQLAPPWRPPPPCRSPAPPAHRLVPSSAPRPPPSPGPLQPAPGCLRRSPRQPEPPPSCSTPWGGGHRPGRLRQRGVVRTCVCARGVCVCVEGRGEASRGQVVLGGCSGRSVRRCTWGSRAGRTAEGAAEEEEEEHAATQLSNATPASSGLDTLSRRLAGLVCAVGHSPASSPHPRP